MESLNASDGNMFSNPKAKANVNATTSTSGFTFNSTSSVSNLSRPRFVKVRKPNNAPAFNPFRNGAAANAAFDNPDFASGIGDGLRNLKIGEGFDAPRRGEFAFATNASSRVDDNPASEQMNKLKIVAEGGTGLNESDLRNDLKKKLNIKKGGGNNAAAENSTHEVLCQLKNLNINNSFGSSVLKSKVDFRPSLGNVTTFEKCETEADLLRTLEKLNLVEEKKEDCVQPNLCDPFSDGIDRRGASGGGGAQGFSEDSRVSQSAASASSSIFFQPVGVSNREGFVFTGKQDNSSSSFVEFKTPAPKVVKEGKHKQKSSKMRMSKSRENLRHYSSTQLWHGERFVLKESVPQGEPQGSPMDVSPYQEKLAENERSRESSLTSNDLSSIDNNPVVDDSVPTSSVDPIDEDLIAATESLNINGGDVDCRDTNREISEDQMLANSSVEDPKDESISGVETESFKSANDEVDVTSDAACVSEDTEAHSDNLLHVGSSFSSRKVSGSAFTFAAASSAEAQSCNPKRHHKKKNVGHDSCNYAPNIKVPYSPSSVAFTPFSGTSSLFTSGQGLKPKVSSTQPKTSDSDENEEKGSRETSASISVATVAAQEACEKWRLR
ncbi:unnamed protein product [Sphenostylis stenocarpa]|uniref:Uncharacterized protein n=1 Tax=Sphenostylis stenocarpa TaxID=92480 RepID=A0AA86VAP3_9FABA|nr:unnamed protein product [Sphenostylis stenocarpa]